jgi:predicted TIM-barrel fold metal-dependent hydrolase
MPHRIIAIEEHFLDAELVAHFGAAAVEQSQAIRDRLFDFLDLRLREMDAAGIDVQVVSHQSPGAQRLGEDVAVAACRKVNDRLAEAIRSTPGRFAGFAMLPTAIPEAAADELERAVEDLGLKGAMIHGPSGGRFLDEPFFWPVFARAERLNVPVYLHPALPHRGVTDVYYATYAKSHPSFLRAAWGFGVETATQAIRLVLSGLFEAHPDLKVVLGHLGEGIPFQLARIDEALSRPGNAPVSFAETFRRNFYVTTSGFFSDPALRCCIEELGVDRILFAVDWPFVRNDAGVNWLSAFDLDPASKESIFGGNARALLRI